VLVLFAITFFVVGLLPGTPVGTSLIDAHAGGAGVMESIPDAGSKVWLQFCVFAIEIAFKTLCMLYIF